MRVAKFDLSYFILIGLGICSYDDHGNIENFWLLNKPDGRYTKSPRSSAPELPSHVMPNTSSRRQNTSYGRQIHLFNKRKGKGSWSQEPKY